ncbi:glycosyltransferase family 2 protein [Cytophagaceae bacterium YF14B1]|uniref:Glycosyltransferase family 2 protein n=1 Tax=Xanthocytophaga flava TaxID=3048013 RepID=A0AAE3U867_9BACT|nr:glycosyltransferase family 2 protein [Xanthocytophaga flavus]MDJ1480364.1 glycosyltransferase family 2 protein [Xanthocytophaga flavus]
MVPNVWAVVVHYNGEEWIHKCLQSLTESVLPLHIVVVDNNSTIQTGIQIIQNKFPHVTFIQSKENIGFGRANNLGIELAMANQADYIFLLNQDAWIESDTIKILISTSLNNPGFGIISPFHLDTTKSALEYGFSKYLETDKCPGIISDIYLKQTREIYPLSFVNAAAWLLTNNCIRTVGIFDPLFFMYGEDLDYCQRCQYHRIRIGVTPHATISHARPHPSGQSSGKLTWKKSEKYKLQGNLLAVLKNINKSLWVQIGTYFILLVKFSLRYTTPLLAILAGMLVLTNLSKISGSRKAQKQQFIHQ